MSFYETTGELLPELEAAETSIAGESEWEDELGFGGIAEIAQRAARSAVCDAFGEGEYEFEAELNPVRRWYPDAMLEHLAHEATEAETEDEAAEAFLPLIPLVASNLLPLAAKAAPLIARSLPRILATVNKVSPQLTRGVANVARTIYRNPQTRPLLRTLPTIARRTVGTLARQAAHRQPITPQVALRTLAQQTGRLLQRPHHCRSAIRRSRVLDTHAHRLVQTSPIVTAPHTTVTAPRTGCRCRCPQCGR